MKYLILIAFLANGYQLAAQHSGSDILRQTMTTYLQYDITSNTYESDTAQSKDTGESRALTFETSAGKLRLLSFGLRSERHDLKFSLNENSMGTHWRDLWVSYRLGWFYPSITGTLADIQIQRVDGDYVDIFKASFGAGLAVKIPVMNSILAFVDIRHYESPGKTKTTASEVSSETNRKLNATLGSRTEGDIGASMDIIREFLDFVVGYRVKSYTLSVESEALSESQSGIYAGVRLGAYF